MKSQENQGNEEFKIELLNVLNENRKITMEFYIRNKEEYDELDSVDKIINLRYDITQLSFFNDNEIIVFLESLGVTSEVTENFVSLNDKFDELDKLSVLSKFLFPYKFIFDLYFAHSKMFLTIQLCENFGFKFSEILVRLKRQETNNNLPNEFKELHEKLLTQKALIMNEKLMKNIPLTEDGLISSMKKINRFPHKVYFQDLYDQLYLHNEQIIRSTEIKTEFKCEFYNLFKLLHRDKEFFENDNEMELNYGDPGNCRFKVKRMESLFSV